MQKEEELKSRNKDQLQRYMVKTEEEMEVESREKTKKVKKVKSDPANEVLVKKKEPETMREFHYEQGVDKKEEEEEEEKGPLSYDSPWKLDEFKINRYRVQKQTPEIKERIRRIVNEKTLDFIHSLQEAFKDDMIAVKNG